MDEVNWEFGYSLLELWCSRGFKKWLHTSFCWGCIET